MVDSLSLYVGPANSRQPSEDKQCRLCGTRESTSGRHNNTTCMSEVEVGLLDIHHDGNNNKHVEGSQFDSKTFGNLFWSKISTSLRLKDHCCHGYNLPLIWTICRSLYLLLYTLSDVLLSYRV